MHAPPISGVVRFPELSRKVQATMTDVATAATVALIDTSTDTTIATTVTDSTGNFQLNISGWSPTPSKVYILEAVKGLSNNLPANDAARVRTLIAYSTSWESIVASAQIVIDPYTTALSAGAALRNAEAGPFDFNSLLGSLTSLSDPDIYSPVTGLSASDYTALSDLVNQALLDNEDPIAAIGLRLPDTWVEPNTPPMVASTSPASLSALQEGAIVTITGSGFDPNPSNDIVKFGDVAAVVTSANPLQMVVSMRGLAAGAISVQVGNLVMMGPAYGVSPFAVDDGTTSAGVDLAYQYSPVGGGGFLNANWTANLNATGYLEQIGSTPGGSDILAPVNVGNVTSYQATALALQGAWTGATYYVTLTPVYPSGLGTPVTSNGVQIAEAVSWDGASTAGLRNAPDGGYSVNFPFGSNETQFYGNHYFETVDIASGTTTYVEPFGKVDGVSEGALMAGVITTPKDGWLGLHANSITVAGLIDASGRGYGGGPGGSILNNSATNGHGGALGLSGDGGGGQYNATAYADNYPNAALGSATGGAGYGGAGGGAEAGSTVGGRGGYMGGGGGGSAEPNPGNNGNDATAAGGAGGNPGGGSGGVAPSYFGPSFGAGSGGGGGSLANQNQTGGGGGGGYGAGGGGGTGDVVYTGWADAGGGGGGTGGGNTYSGANSSGGGNTGGSSFGLGWAPGILSRANNGLGGPAGDYLPGGAAVGDTSTDLSWVLGSGGAGGNSQCLACGALGQYVYDAETGAGGGGGSGGGAIILMGQSVSVSGTLVGIGAAGGGGSGDDGNGGAGGGGGGGSGGAIVIHGGSVSLTGTLNVLGGTAGGNGNGGTTGGNGGNDGVSSATGGTIKVFYHTFSGTLPTTATAGRVYSSAF